LIVQWNTICDEIKKILKFLKSPPTTPFLKNNPPPLFKKILVQAISSSRYRHQRPLPLFFRKKGNQTIKKEKIKKEQA